MLKMNDKICKVIWWEASFIDKMSIPKIWNLLKRRVKTHINRPPFIRIFETYKTLTLTNQFTIQRNSFSPPIHYDGSSLNLSIFPSFRKFKGVVLLSLKSATVILHNLSETSHISYAKKSHRRITYLPRLQRHSIANCECEKTLDF